MVYQCTVASARPPLSTMSGVHSMVGGRLLLREVEGGERTSTLLEGDPAFIEVFMVFNI